MNEDKKKKEAKNKKRFDEETARLRKKLRDNDVSFWKEKAQKVFNQYIRWRDSGLGCISCDKDKYWSGQWHAGHYKTVGAHSELRFNEHNCHKQCSQCNNYLSGNLNNYRKELIKRIGLENVERLEKSQEIPRYRIEDYKAIYEKYKNKMKTM